jgi:hypothetical protein
LRKLVGQVFTSEGVGESVGSSPCDSEVIRCSLCGKRYTTVAARAQHQDGCVDHVIRDKNEFVASVLNDFFTSSKQSFIETRAQALEVLIDSPCVVDARRSRKNWADKESQNEFAVLPDAIREAIKSFFIEERVHKRKVKPHDVAKHLLQSLVSPTNWEAKFLLTEQRLKSEVSRLVNQSTKEVQCEE